MHGGFAVPKPTRTVLTLLGVNVAAYVLQLILLRTGFGGWVEKLYLTPHDVYARGYVWQLVSYGFLHSPESPWHLLSNMLWLWIVGPQMEAHWGKTRFLKGYFIFLLAGAALTVLVGALAETPVLAGVLPHFPTNPHIGASGAVLGIVVAWGLVHADRRMHVFLLGEVTGKTIVLLLVGLQILTALSFANVSITAHVGGMLAAVVLYKGLWRPARWKQMLRRRKLKATQSALEKELRDLERGGHPRKPPKGWQVIDGGQPGDDPKKWN